MPVNGRRGRPQGKCHRNQTAAAWRHPAVRAKRCGKSAPRPQQWGWQGKPHPEQGRIGADGAAPQGAGAGALPPFRPGWPREARSNAGSRGMAVHAPQGARQNPAYRPSDATFHLNAFSSAPSARNPGRYCKFMRQMPSQRRFLACRPRLSHGIPSHPIKTLMRSGGRAGFKRDGRASRRGRGAPSAAETPGL